MMRSARTFLEEKCQYKDPQRILLLFSASILSRTESSFSILLFHFSFCFSEDMSPPSLKLMLFRVLRKNCPSPHEFANIFFFYHTAPCTALHLHHICVPAVATGSKSWNRKHVAIGLKLATTSALGFVWLQNLECHVCWYNMNQGKLFMNQTSVSSVEELRKVTLEDQ